MLPIRQIPERDRHGENSEGQQASKFLNSLNTPVLSAWRLFWELENLASLTLF
jgi:hypothetical protein